jgi:hypothetical protein
MCGAWHSKETSVCDQCGHTEMPVDKYSKNKFYKLMQRFEYEKTEYGGYRILKVCNTRSLELRFSVGLPHFVTEIGDGAFEYCKFISEIELPNGLRSVGDGAFAYCKSLDCVFIPASVTRMGKAVFNECFDLREIRCAAPEKPEGWDDAWLDGCDATVQWGGGG